MFLDVFDTLLFPGSPFPHPDDADPVILYVVDVINLSRSYSERIFQMQSE